MDRWCKSTPVRHLCLLLAAWSLVAVQPADAAEVRVQSDTLLRYFERDADSGGSAGIAPLYEYLQADVGSLTTRGLALHLYGWGRADLGDGGYYREDADGELLYGYLEYSSQTAGLNLRLGRQYVFAGLANGAVDGLRVAADLGPYFSFSAYGGLPVAFAEDQGRSGDLSVGGRLAQHLGSRYEFGVSYRKIESDGDLQDQQAGIDLYLALPGGISLDGRSTYNLETDGWGEHAYQGHLAIAGLQLRPFFEHYSYRDFFAPGDQTPNPFRTLARGNEILTSYGAELSWPLTAAWEIGAKLKFYSYDVNPEGATYASGLVTWHGEELTQAGGELGYLAGEAAGNKDLVVRLYFYWDRPAGLPLTFVSGDLVYAGYDRAILDEDRSFFASLGAGRRFLDERLELRLSGDYSADPNFDSDWRGMLAASYHFSR